MRRNQVIGHDAPFDEMFADDSLENGRIASPVPRAFRIDDSNWSAFTDAETVGLRAQHAALLRKSKLLQPALEKLPRCLASLQLATFGLRLVAAQENVPARDGDPDRHRDCPQGVR